MKMKTIILMSLVMMLSVGIIFAATPSEIITDLTGLSATEVSTLRAGGKTYGQIAQDANLLDEYQALILNEKIALINQRVAEGVYTQDQANTFISRLSENQATCDPNQPSRIMSGTGFRFGGANGQGNGSGQGFGQGNGFGLKDGSGVQNGNAGNGMGFRRNVNN